MAGVTLREYQDKALCRMKNGCILNGGVGSGKSRTSIAYYYIQHGGRVYYYKCNPDTGKYDVGPYIHDTLTKVDHATYVEMKNPKDLYIITTAKKRDSGDWDGELAPFLMSTDPTNNKYKNKIVVDSWNNIGKYIDVKNSFFIFDEQRVPGYGAWVKSFLKICKSNEWILLSATPGDKWEDYIPVFIANGFYKNKTDFSQKHLVYSRFTNYPKIEKYMNEAHLMRLKRDILIEMDFQRTTVRHHEHIICNYDIDKYNYITKSKWNIYKDKPIENAGEFCLCLRQLVNSDISRQMHLLEIIDKHPKAIIFYNQDYELEILRKLFEKYPHAEWNGHKHMDIPEGPAWVYLVQYTAGCEGWNCTTTDTIIFFSQNYSYKVMEQASGRIDRLNTPYTDLYYFHMRSESKIDNAIRQTLRKKKKFNENTFAPDFKKPEKRAPEQLSLLDMCEQYNSWEDPENIYYEGNKKG